MFVFSTGVLKHIEATKVKGTKEFGKSFGVQEFNTNPLLIDDRYVILTMEGMCNNGHRG